MKTFQSTIKAAQRGFTLIELMIVLAIVGIIAVVAAPIFTDYTIRARVSEASNVFSGMKTAVDIHYQSNGAFPTATDVPNVGGTAVADAAGEWVQSAAVGAATTGNDGRITITMRGDTAVEDDLGGAAPSGTATTGGAAGGTIIYTATDNNGRLTWEIDTTLSTVPDEYLPGS